MGLLKRINKIIFINFGGRKEKPLFFVFLTYLPVFFLKFRSGELIGFEIKFCIQRVPTRHTFEGPRYPKKKKYLKKRDDDVIITFFSSISWFWGSRVYQKYSLQVLVGCGIKFCIQRALPLGI